MNCYEYLGIKTILELMNKAYQKRDKNEESFSFFTYLSKGGSEKRCGLADRQGYEIRSTGTLYSTE